MTIHAPYNFVPLSGWIFRPPWAAAVSHDLPLAGALGGTLEIELTAHTPLLVGGKQRKAEKDREGEVEFMRLPDGGFAIPGSTLKGAIRNLLEIAAFGKMRQVDDRWLSFRDLYLEEYKRHLTDEVGKMTYRPKAESGWLEFVGSDGWRVTPCRHARVEQSDLIRWGTTLNIQGADQIRFRNRANHAYEKYKIWRDHLEADFTIESAKPRRHSGGIQLEYAKVTQVGKGGTRGRIVFTGQPADNDGKPRRKHMEFVFHDDGRPEPLREEVIRAFLHIHEESEEWRNLWRGKVNAGERIPVFFLRDPRGIASLGLAMMYRLPYAHSIGDTLAHTHPDHRAAHIHDLPELLFGVINDVPQGEGPIPLPNLKSRVSFGLARQDGEVREERGLPVTILNGPKPTYYPAYLRQEAEPVREYKTYQDRDAELRGWKRYPVRPQARVQPLTEEQRNGKSKATQTRLRPLAAGAKFRATVRFHNLLPEELGALAWALEWGGDPDKRHALGMGKPFGFGQTSIRVTGGRVRENSPRLLEGDGWSEVTGESLAEWRVRFESAIDTAFRGAQHQAGRGEPIGWRESEQLVQLLAMADPAEAPGRPGKLEHMRLSTKPRVNEFVEAKKAREALAEYGNFRGPNDEELFPRAPGGIPGGGPMAGPSDPWVAEQLTELAKKNNATEEEVLRGKALAQAWQALEEGEEKRRAREAIVSAWQAKGWWDMPPSGKAMKQARKLYEAEVEE